MKRLGILVLVLLFCVSLTFAGGNPFKRIADAATNTFKNEVQKEVAKEKKVLMKEFNEIKKAAKTVQDKWDAYNDAKLAILKIKNTGNLTEIVANYLVVGEWAKELKRNDILSWQYNNIGWQFIKKVNVLTKNGTKKVEEAEKYIKEAKKYLKMAEKLEKKIKTGKKRKDTIERNLETVIARELLFK